MDKKILLFFFIFSQNECSPQTHLSEKDNRNFLISWHTKDIELIQLNAALYLHLADVCDDEKIYSMGHHIYYALYNFKLMKKHISSKSFLTYYLYFKFHKNQILFLYDNIDTEIRATHLEDGNNQKNSILEYKNIKEEEFKKLSIHTDLTLDFLKQFQLPYYQTNFSSLVPSIINT